MRKILIATIIIFAVSPVLFASGWNDYELDIGGGYKIFRTNTLDISIGKSNGFIILDPRNFEHVGPVVSYQALDLFILAKTKGRKDRNLFEGDTFQDVDYDKEYYFILRKSDDFIFGPYNPVQFQDKINELKIEPAKWIQPKNPNRRRAIIGSLIFTAIAIPILAVKYFYISIPILILFIWGVIRFIKNKKRRTSHSSGLFPPQKSVGNSR